MESFLIRHGTKGGTTVPQADASLSDIAYSREDQFLRRLLLLDVAPTRTQLILQIMLGPSLVCVVRHVRLDPERREQSRTSGMYGIELILTDLSSVSTR